MYRFLYPQTETTAFDMVIRASSLEAAFEHYKDLWWDDRWVGHVAVFELERLVGRVVPEINPDSGRNEPRLELWP
jgi:hypothetical protein